MSGVGRSLGILPIAALSARLALRSKLVPAVVILTLGATIFASVVADGSPSERMQAFLAWSIDFDVFVLSLTAVFLSTTIAGAIREGKLVQVCAAPVRRELVLIGWWLGTVGVLALLVAICAFTVWATANAMVVFAPDDRTGEAMDGMLRAHGVVRPLPPDPAEVEKNVTDAYKELAQSGRLPANMSPEEVLERLHTYELTRRRTVPRGFQLDWSLEGIHPREDAEALILRFRYQVQTEQPIALEEFPLVSGVFGVGAPGVPPVGKRGNWQGGRTQELLLPTEVLEDGDRLNVLFRNVDRRPVLIVFPEHGIEILYPAGSFAGNVLGMALVLLGRLLFLAAVGVAAAGLIDRRLAAGVALWFLVIGAGAGFLQESLTPGAFGAVDAPLQALLRSVLYVLPDLGRDSLSDLLASSQAIETRSVFTSLFGDGIGRGGLVLLVGALLFGRRELGAVRE